MSRNVFLDFQREWNGLQKGERGIEDILRAFSESVMHGAYRDEVDALKERDVWKVLLRVYQEFSKNAPCRGGETFEAPVAIDPVISTQRTVLASVLEKKQSARMFYAIKNWLEETSDNFDSDSRSDPFHFEKSRRTAEAEEITTEFDPDATIRLGKRRHRGDEDDEIWLLQKIWLLLRSGKISDIEQLCVDGKQHWRAGSIMFGLRMYMTTNVDDVHGVEVLYRRLLWKKTCASLCSNESIPVEERAIYGFLGGSLEHALLKCSTWKDCLWVYVHCLLEREIDEAILLSVPSEKRNYSSPSINVDNFASIFGILSTSHSPAVRYGANLFQSRVIQSLTTLDVNIIDSFVATFVGEIHSRTPNDVRTVTHVALILRSLGCPISGNLFSLLLKKYVSDLRKLKNYEAVATYVSELPSDEEKMEEYVDFMVCMTAESGIQNNLLEWAREAGLPLEEISRRVVEDIREDVLHGTNEMGQKMKVQSLEWLCMISDERQAVVQANALIRRVILNSESDPSMWDDHEIGSLWSIFDTILQNVTEVIKNEMSELDDYVREYQCWYLYFDALRKHELWRSHIERGTEFVHSKDVWSDQERPLRESTIESCSLVLHYQGGWLRLYDSHPEYDTLQNRCIPEILFLLVDLFSKVKGHDECLELVADISDPQSRSRVLDVLNRANLKPALSKLLLEHAVLQREAVVASRS